MSEAVAVESPEVNAGQPAPAESGSAAQNPADKATADTGAEKAPEQQKTDEQPEKRGQSRFERRLDRAYRRAAEEKARADLLERRIQELAPKQAPQPTGAPKLSDFDDIERYAEAKAKFESDLAIKRHEEMRASESAKAEQQRLVQSWETKIEKAEAKYEDFHDLVGELNPASALVRAIMEAENGDDIAYYLARNQQEAVRIASLPERSQLREIGKLEAKLLSDPPKPKKLSEAPAPIKPLTGAEKGSSNVPSENDDMATWIKKRQKQVHG